MPHGDLGGWLCSLPKARPATGRAPRPSPLPERPPVRGQFGGVLRCALHVCVDRSRGHKGSRRPRTQPPRWAPAPPSPPSGLPRRPSLFRGPPAWLLRALPGGPRAGGMLHSGLVARHRFPCPLPPVQSAGARGTGRLSKGGPGPLRHGGARQGTGRLRGASPRWGVQPSQQPGGRTCITSFHGPGSRSTDRVRGPLRVA